MLRTKTIKAKVESIETLNNNLLPLIFLCLLMLLIFSAIFAGDAAAETAEKNEEGIEVFRVDEEVGSGKKYFEGFTKPAGAARVMPGIGGDLIEIYPDIGDRVETGDRIARLEAEKLDLGIKAGEKALEQIEKELEMAEAGARKEELKQVEARYEAARESFEIAEDHHRRVKYLYEHDVAPKTELDEAEQRLNEARAEYKTAEQSLEMSEQGARPEEIDILKAAIAEAEYELEKARVDQQDLKVTAPVEGTIGELPIDEGALVGDDTVLAVIMEMEELKFSVETTAGRAADIRRGQPAELSFDSHPEETFRGMVDEIYPAADEGSGQFEFNIALPNPDSRLRAGEYGEARITTEENDYLEIPSSALVENDNPKIYLVESEMLKEVEVEIISRSEDKVEIAGDLEKGDLIVYEAKDEYYHGHPAELIEVVDS
ncbi:efflux RND transporter periplasmic adaptor subunit [Halarsenatibacter silvermanii]|uniref:RND family efflux transporter, MFP subunit n=1 Tax=Halarsenatibacter silvermanii TaxID=321763 RepID=A0A1G9KZ97_9FIRM|nr:efflux RND transporter periplasmic adaptor subunit [Halarsenatibacter silvermanii]SDL55058.1 RND family efflux transporter, MFP subunit [Halarsenatibacter silvermanii]